MKKIISAFLAAVTAAALSSVPVIAEESARNATYCFDNDSAITAWESYGSTDLTGLELSVTKDKKESGDGALCISENITSDISEDQQFGGVYFTAESLGLEDFKGCTVRMSVLFDENAADAVSDFTVFSDGVVWITSGISDENSGRWSKVSLTVPENASNTKIGFTIPVYSQYSGAVAYVDNVVVYKADGTAIENQGDYSLTSDGITVSIGTGGRIGLVIVLVILIFAIIGGIGFVVSTCLKRFT